MDVVTPLDDPLTYLIMDHGTVSEWTIEPGEIIDVTIEPNQITVEAVVETREALKSDLYSRDEHAVMLTVYGEKGRPIFNEWCSLDDDVDKKTVTLGLKQ